MTGLSRAIPAQYTPSHTIASHTIPVHTITHYREPHQPYTHHHSIASYLHYLHGHNLVCLLTILMQKLIANLTNLPFIPTPNTHVYMHARAHRQTDRQTDRQTHTHTHTNHKVEGWDFLEDGNHKC